MSCALKELGEELEYHNKIVEQQYKTFSAIGGLASKPSNDDAEGSQFREMWIASMLKQQENVQKQAENQVTFLQQLILGQCQAGKPTVLEQVSKHRCLLSATCNRCLLNLFKDVLSYVSVTDRDPIILPPRPASASCTNILLLDTSDVATAALPATRTCPVAAAVSNKCTGRAAAAVVPCKRTRRAAAAVSNKRTGHAAAGAAAVVPAMRTRRAAAVVCNKHARHAAAAAVVPCKRARLAAAVISTKYTRPAAAIVPFKRTHRAAAVACNKRARHAVAVIFNWCTRRAAAEFFPSKRARRAAAVACNKRARHAAAAALPFERARHPAAVACNKRARHAAAALPFERARRPAAARRAAVVSAR